MLKREEYCLSLTYPRGGHNARVFAAALGLTGDDTALLRDALKTNPPAEAKKRIETLLAAFAPPAVPEGEVLRGVRAVWALERIGTADARRLLEDLAKGVESARLTREAKAALGRMK